MPAQIDVSNVHGAARGSAPFVLSIEGSSPESFAQLDGILEVFLAELGQEKIQEVLSYCIKELILNAEKANAKRIYFEEHALDISKPVDYERGMKDFPEDMSRNLEHFLRGMRDRRMTIDVVLRSNGRTFAVSVMNDAALSSMEEARIRERIVRARRFGSFSEALETSVDNAEGAGLGIMILLQFLKSIGLGEDAFSIGTENGKTISSITIPISNVTLDQIRVLGEELAREISSLPHFPDRVAELARLTEDPTASVGEVSDHISRDPTLTAELLKHVNSAYYALPSRVNSVSQAVKLIGLRSLHQLSYSLGFHEILEENKGAMKSLWDDSVRTAYYAFVLARDVRRKREILDDVYVTGLLHNLGYIVVRSLHPRVHEKLLRICRERNIPSSVFEKFTFGMNHAEMGALIAQKWNFPDQLIEGIKYHQNPLLASLKHQDVVFCVYLADAICDLERELIGYRQLDRTVLADFGIRTEAQLLDVAAKLRASFDSRSARPA